MDEHEYKIGIVNGSSIYYTPAEDGIEWTTYRVGQAGELTFRIPPNETTVKADLGNLVMFHVDSNPVFYGWIREIETDQDGGMRVRAVDQLGFLNYVERYTFKNKTADEIIWIIAPDFPPLKCSPDIPSTGYRIPLQIEDGTPIFDIILNALDTTLKETGVRYTLYDDYGKLMLASNEDMKISNMMLTADNIETFSYSANLNDTYNVIKLVKTDTAADKNVISMVIDSESIAKYGTMQYYEEITDADTDAEARANLLLSIYNKPSRSLRITAPGDVRIRAGSFIPVSLKLAGILQNSFLVVDSVTHRFGTEYTMDIRFSGDGFKA